MQPGQLQHKCELQRPATGADAMGQPLTGWSRVGDIWADIRYGTGLEAIRGGAITSVVQASLRIHWRPDIQPSWRVVQGGKKFKILAVKPDPTGRSHLDLVCEVS